MASEQLLERPVQTVPRSEVTPAPRDTSPNESAARGDFSPDPFSPDPSRRTDRYRLVTPFLLRL